MISKNSRGGEQGQILPVLLTAIVGFLAITLLILQMGHAGDLRTRTRSAADAAALAAAEDIKDRALSVLEQGNLPYGIGFTDTSRQAAVEYANRNDADVTAVEARGVRAVHVEVRSQRPLGEGLADVEDTHATAEATAEATLPSCYITSNAPSEPAPDVRSLVCDGDTLTSWSSSEPTPDLSSYVGPLIDVQLIPESEAPPPGASPTGPIGPIPPGGVSNAANRQLGKDIAAQRGWTGQQWACLDQLWQHESGWDHTATNPNSGAYGIPQSLPASKMASAGSDWRTNPRTQIAWGLDYIAGRYGTPCGAWGAWQSRSPHWY